MTHCDELRNRPRWRVMARPAASWFVIVCCLLRGVTGTAPVRAQDAGQAAAAVIEVRGYQDVITPLRDIIQYEREIKQLPAFSIAMVADGQIIWAEGFGYQDADRQVPATADTIYRVGSVSKLFTDIKAMQWAEQGKLELDVPVQQYLPSFHPTNTTDTPITLRQLMSHRSGLVREPPVGHYFDPDEPTLAKTVESLNDTSIVYPPGTRTKYSNAGISVVGAVLEQQFDGTYEQQITEGVLQPLGMEFSGFVVRPEMESRLATGWMWTYDGRRFEVPTFALGTAPAGNLYASVSELSKFWLALLNPSPRPEQRLLQPDTWKDMSTAPVDPQTGKPLDFGIGFHVQQLDGERKIGHGGAVYGFSTQAEALPERRIAVTAACALDGSNGVVGRIVDHALRMLVAKQDGKKFPVYARTTAVPAERGARLIGYYRDGDAGQVASIRELDGRLYFHRGTFQHEIRATHDGGELVIDDPIDFGTRIQLNSQGQLVVDNTTYTRMPDEPPGSAPEEWRGLIGEYGWDHNVLYILEHYGQLYALIEWFYYYPLQPLGDDRFAFPDYGLYHGETVEFTRDATGRATQALAAGVRFDRRAVGTPAGETFKITPVRPVDELREQALAAKPPEEEGSFRASELVEVVSIDPSIKLDVRYATTNNFMGAVFYDQPRAFLQRPAAEAVVRVHRRLGERGLGLLIHDAYRPWYVTKMFWDATPEELKDFVANPANGSRHNRGCAVDLTLFDVASGQPIEMVAGYDEFSPRSYPLYPGGTSRQRWYREFLRRAMEAEGFRVYEYEWWHFDYRDWKQYRIGNATFEEILQQE